VGEIGRNPERGEGSQISWGPSGPLCKGRTREVRSEILEGEKKIVGETKRFLQATNRRKKLFFPGEISNYTDNVPTMERISRSLSGERSLAEGTRAPSPGGEMHYISWEGGGKKGVHLSSGKKGEKGKTIP